MKKIWTDFKCFITAVVTIVLVALIIVPVIQGKAPSDSIIAVFCTEIGAVFTYYFTKKDKNQPDQAEADAIEDDAEVIE